MKKVLFKLLDAEILLQYKTAEERTRAVQDWCDNISTCNDIVRESWSDVLSEYSDYVTKDLQFISLWKMYERLKESGSKLNTKADAF